MLRVRFLGGPPTLSERAQKAFQLAHQEAHRLNHPAVGTEQLLLGLAKEALSPAARLLREAGFHLPWLRGQVARRSPPRDDADALPAALPYTGELAEFLGAALDAGQRVGVLPLTPELLLLVLTEQVGLVGEVFRLRRLARWRLRRRLRARV